VTQNLVRKFGEEGVPFGFKNEILVGDAIFEQAVAIRRAIRWWEGVLDDVETRANTLLAADLLKSKAAKKMQKIPQSVGIRQISLPIELKISIRIFLMHYPVGVLMP